MKTPGPWIISLIAILDDPALSNALFENFIKTKDALDVYSLLDRYFYWKEGEYDLELVVKTSRPTGEFKKNRISCLEKSDEDQLRLNVVTIVKQLCGLQTYNNFAYPGY